MEGKFSTSTKLKWSLITTGESNVHFQFNSEPKQPKGLNVYYFHYTYKNPRTGKYGKGKITTGEKDFRRAKEKRDELKDQVNLKLFSSEIKYSDKQAIGEFFESFLEAKEQEKLKWNTLYDYRLKIQTFIEFADFDLPLCNIDSTLLRRFFAQIKSESVRKLTYRILRAAFNFAVLEDKLEKNPIDKVTMKEGSKPKREWLTLKDFMRIYEKMPEITYVQRTAKNAALFGFAIGARSGEICNVLVRKINWERREIDIVKTDSFDLKNGCERTIKISPRLEKAILNQRKNKASHCKETVRESPYLFTNEAGKPYVKSSAKGSKLSKLFMKVCREVFPDREGIHFHSLRHSFIQNAVNDGRTEIEIAKITGHTDLNSLRSYIKISDYTSKGMEDYLDKQSVIGLNYAIKGELTEKEIIKCVQTELTT